MRFVNFRGANGLHGIAINPEYVAALRRGSSLNETPTMTTIFLAGVGAYSTGVTVLGTVEEVAAALTGQ